MATTTKSLELKGLLVNSIGTSAELEADGSVFIKGFASMKAMDREGDTIDPKLFNVSEFLKNGQLLFDHKKWKTAEGNEINIGKVTELYVARVERIPSGNGQEFRVLDMKGNILEESVSADLDFELKRGDKGLWVKAHVMEPDVAKMIVNGRLSAFSWRGTIFSKADGTPTKIDLHEISVVNIPANSKALFVVGKAFEQLETDSLVALQRDGAGAVPISNQALLRDDLSSTQHFAVAVQKDAEDSFVFFMPDRVKTAQEATAIARGLSNVFAAAAVALQPTGKMTEMGSPVFEILSVQSFEKEASGMTDLEKALLKRMADNEDTDIQDVVKGLTGEDTGSPQSKQEGGEEEMDANTQKTLEELTAGISALVEMQKTNADAIEKLGERLNADETAEKEEEAKEADADATEAKAEPEATETKSEEKSEADEDALAAVLKALAGSIDELKEGNDLSKKAINELADRIDGLENKPAAAKTITDEEKPDMEANMEAAVEKAIENLSPDVVKTARRRAWANTIMPSELIGRR